MIDLSNLTEALQDETFVLPQLNDFKKSLSSGRSVIEQYKKDELCSAGKRFEIFAEEIEGLAK